MKEHIKKFIAVLLIICMLNFVGCNKISTDDISSSSYIENVETIVENSTVTSTETSSVSSEAVVSSNTITPSDAETSSEETTSSETSSVVEAPVTKPRPEKVTKIYEFNVNTTVSEPLKQTFTDQQNGNVLPYCLYVPDNYTSSKKYPVILFLHGAGEIGNDNTLQINNIKNMFTYNADYIAQSILICPQTPEWWRLDRDFYGDGQGPLTSAMHLLEEIQGKYSCDENRIYLTGLSMGSFATWELLGHYGDVFAAAVPVCGGNEMSADKYVNIPIVMYHGTADPTVSFQSSQRTYDAIVAAGGTKALLIPLEGVGHDAWKHAYADRNMFAWLFSQDKSKDSFVKYQVAPSFRVVDSDGNNVITSEDLLLVDYEINGDNADVKLRVSSSGKSKLEKAYTTSGGKEFTVYCLSQKIYSYTATTPPIDNMLLITGVFSSGNYLAFYQTVDAACMENMVFYKDK